MGRWDSKPDVDYPLNGEIRVKDEGGVDITDGEILAVTGSSGPRLLVTKADADTTALRDAPLFVAFGNAAANSILAAHPWRLIRNVDTSAATINDPVYLSGTAGGWTLTPPAVAVQVGVVEKVSATTGAILLAPGMLRSSSTSLLGAAMVDNALVRGDGTARIQPGTANAIWYLDDTGLLRAPLAVDGTPIYSAVRFEGSSGVYGTIGCISTGPEYRISTSSSAMLLKIDAAGALTLEAGDGAGVGDLTLTVGDELILTAYTGWKVEGTSYTTAQIVDLFAIAGLAVTDGNIIVGNGTTWVAESGSTARKRLGIGPPEQNYKAVANQQSVTSAVTVTFPQQALDSDEVTYSGGEHTVSVAGTYAVEWWVAVTAGTSGSGTVLEVWMTDDTALQGTDVETAGTRGYASDTPGAVISGKRLIALDAGDTVMLKAERTAGAGTCTVGAGTGSGGGAFTIQRIG